MTRGNLIILGASARAAAQSAIRAGYAPWCIDLFADRDLQAIAPVKRCPREQWPRGVLDLMRDAPPGPVLLTGGMENDDELVWAIERSRTLIGPSWKEIVPLRAPGAAGAAIREYLLRACRSRGFHEGAFDVPAVAWDDDVSARTPDELHRYLGARAEAIVLYLVKPRHGTGGRAIQAWSPGGHVSSSDYVQRFVHGRSLSGVFNAHAGSAVLVGITEQIVGDPGFGAASDFTYVGNIFPARVGPEVTEQFELAGEAIASWSGLEGVFGIDAVLSDRADADQPLNVGRIHVVEINPRYPASAELIERSGRCAAVLDPVTAATSRWQENRAAGGFFGKAIVFADADRLAPDLMTGFARGRVADIPEVGEVIHRHQPVCTVFAVESTRDACYGGLRSMADKVYTRLQPA